jgi:hypothetical protein
VVNPVAIPYESTEGGIHHFTQQICICRKLEINGFNKKDQPEKDGVNQKEKNNGRLIGTEQSDQASGIF